MGGTAQARVLSVLWKNPLCSVLTPGEAGGALRRECRPGQGAQLKPPFKARGLHPHLTGKGDPRPPRERNDGSVCDSISEGRKEATGPAALMTFPKLGFGYYVLQNCSISLPVDILTQKLGHF